MNDNYTKWLESEKNWIDEKEKKYKKDVVKYCLLGLAGAMVVFGAIGLLAGGGLDIDGMLHNILIIAIIGIVFILLMCILTKSSLPAKRYMKNLKSEIEDVLSPEERESFARQMLGMEENVQEISWVDGGKFEGETEEKVRITRDYALKTASDGAVSMVQLQKVEKMVTDVREYTVTTRGGGFKIQQTSTVYPLYFYYQKPAEEEKRVCDKEFTFKKRQEREEVSHYLHEMKIDVESCGL